jgi:hypothetical protein
MMGLLWLGGRRDDEVGETGMKDGFDCGVE